MPTNNITFSPLNQTIEEIFDGSTNFYTIPDYQRQYSWNNIHIDELFDDVYGAFKDYKDGERTDYFLGSIILISTKENGLEVVDGQQRLTTLIILFCVLRDFFLKDDDKIKNSIKSLVKKEYRLRFKTHFQEQNNFEQEILNGIRKDLLEDKDKKKKNRFINTAFLFKEKLDNIGDLSIINEFSKFIFSNIHMIAITCNNQSYAIRLFQTLNDRGLDLSNSDLVKSYLYNKFDNDKKNVFISDWTALEKIAKYVNEDMDGLLTIYEYYLLAANPKKLLYEELVNQFERKENMSLVLYEIKNIIENYEEVYESESKLFYSFRYLPDQTYWKVLLATAKSKKIVYFDELCDKLRRMFYLYWIAGYYTSKIKYLIFEIIKLLKDEKDLIEIEKKIEDKIKADGVIALVKNNLNEDVYGKPWITPLLILLEYNKTDNSKPAFIERNNKLHVDHILPIGWESIDEWKKLDWKNNNANILLNKIGNLTLLSGKKNIIQKNRPPLEKAKVYLQDGESAFILAQEIITYLEKGEWKEKEVTERQERIIKEITNFLNLG